jgi:hypothetical protein
MLWLLSSTALAECPPTQPASALEPPLARAEAAVASLDPGALEHALEDARAVLGCLAEVPEPEVVSRYHGLTGIAAYVAGRTEEAIEAFAVPRRTGSWTLPADISGPLRQVWEGVDPSASDVPRPLATIDPAWWAVDGARAAQAPTTRPFLLQRVGADGGAEVTWLLGSGALPEGAAPMEPDRVAVEPAPVGPSRPRTSRTLLISGLGAAALGAGAAVGAAAVERTYMASPEPDAELGGLKAANAALGWSAVGLLVAGGGLGTGAVIAGRW